MLDMSWTQCWLGSEEMGQSSMRRKMFAIPRLARHKAQWEGAEASV
jgi:hypothetical protein